MHNELAIAENDMNLVIQYNCDWSPYEVPAIVIVFSNALIILSEVRLL